MPDLLRVSDLTPKSPILISTPDGDISLSVDDVIRWIAPDAPPEEALKLLLICRNCGLNPFEGEAYIIDYGGKWQVVFAQSGWLHRAENHPAYDGHQSGIIIQRIDDSKKPYGDTYEIEGSFLPPNHIVKGGWATVYRKDRRFPTKAKISINEYRQEKSPTWTRLTCTMCEKTALIHGIRKSGVVFVMRGYDKVEMPQNDAVPRREDPGPIPDAIMAEYRESPMSSLSPDLAVGLKQAIADLEMSDYQQQVMLAKRHVAHLTELTDKQGQDLLIILHGKIDHMNLGQRLLPDSPDSPDSPSGQMQVEEKRHEVLEDGTVIDEGGEVVPDYDMLNVHDSIEVAKLAMAIDLKLSGVSDDVANKLIDAMSEATIELESSSRHEVPEQVMEDIDSVVDRMIEPSDDPDVVVSKLVADFGIPDSTDTSEISDVIRPETPDSKKSRRKTKS